MNSQSAIREALQALPNLSVASSGNRPLLEEVYFPESHAEVLDPEVSLVIGNRGMGKTFWSLALSDGSLRPEIAKRYSGLRRLRLDNLDVVLGFADAEGVLGIVSRAELATVPKRTATDVIWRAVLIKKLAEIAGEETPETFKELVAWVGANPAKQLQVFRKADEVLGNSGKRVLFLFDQLEQMANDWQRIQDLAMGLMKVALATKSYRNIKFKVFMRPDQAENKAIFRFPDASKVLGGARVLSWKTTDLYGLLFFEIIRSGGDGRQGLFALCADAGVNPKPLHSRLSIPESLAGNMENQGLVFDQIAGSQMGVGAKRGRPYTWIPTHLADGRGEISPRTFLKVMKTAAEFDRPTPEDSAVDFHGIQEGVRQASSNRLTDLEEDYPWVSMALTSLKGVLVPCSPSDIVKKWRMAKAVDQIARKHASARAPVDLVFAGVFEEKEAEELLLRHLKNIGVFEERSNGKINVPDIFRVHAGILRRGGVTPQQRRRLE